MFCTFLRQSQKKFCLKWALIFHNFCLILGSIILLGIRNSVLWRFWGWQQPNCVFWLYHRSRKERWCMDQSCWHLSLSQVLFFISFSLFPRIADCYSSILIFTYRFRFFLNYIFTDFLFSLSFTPSNGRAVHYNGSSLLQWKSVRLDVALLPGEMEWFFSPKTICLVILFFCCWQWKMLWHEFRWLVFLLSNLFWYLCFLLFVIPWFIQIPETLKIVFFVCLFPSIEMCLIFK